LSNPQTNQETSSTSKNEVSHQVNTTLSKSMLESQHHSTLSIEESNDNVMNVPSMEKS